VWRFKACWKNDAWLVWACSLSSIDKSSFSDVVRNTQIALTSCFKEIRGCVGALPSARGVLRLNHHEARSTLSTVKLQETFRYLRESFERVNKVFLGCRSCDIVVVASGSTAMSSSRVNNSFTRIVLMSCFAGKQMVHSHLFSNDPCWHCFCCES